MEATAWKVGTEEWGTGNGLVFRSNQSFTPYSILPSWTKPHVTLEINKFIESKTQTLKSSHDNHFNISEGPNNRCLETIVRNAFVHGLCPIMCNTCKKPTTTPPRPIPSSDHDLKNFLPLSNTLCPWHHLETLPLIFKAKVKTETRALSCASVSRSGVAPALRRG